MMMRRVRRTMGWRWENTWMMRIWVVWPGRAVGRDTPVGTPTRPSEDVLSSDPSQHHHLPGLASYRGGCRGRRRACLLFGKSSWSSSSVGPFHSVDGNVGECCRWKVCWRRRRQFADNVIYQDGTLKHIHTHTLVQSEKRRETLSWALKSIEVRDNEKGESDVMYVRGWQINCHDGKQQKKMNRGREWESVKNKKHKTATFNKLNWHYLVFFLPLMSALLLILLRFFCKRQRKFLNKLN